MAVKSYIRTVFALFLMGASVIWAPASIASETLYAKHLSTGADISVSALKTGDQLVVSALNGAHDVAGHSVSFTQFSGVFGQSSDIAYILVAEGRAKTDSAEAKAGEVLLLMPYGGDTVVQRYAARRFLDSWSDQAINANPGIYQRFKKVSNKQRWGLFFGRLEPTNFNVTAPGSSAQELARRSVVGDEAVQQIRFSGITEPEAVEREVVARFVNALAVGDAETVASLMDPSPFGMTDLRGGAGGARLLMAERLIASHDWQKVLGPTAAAERTANDGEWRIANGARNTVLGLRPIGDFTYIKTIETEL